MRPSSPFRHSPTTLPAVLVAALTLAPTARAQSAPSAANLGPEIGQRATAMYPQLKALYEDIHSHPELGFQETRTAALLARDMRALGFTVTEKVGGTGVVALYRNGTGPTVMVRTELDALPMEEKTGRTRAARRRSRTAARPSSRTVAATTST